MKRAPDIDALYSDLLRLGERPVEVRRRLAGRELEEDEMRALLRRPVPRCALEAVAAQEPWRERPRVLAAVVLNPRVPRALALRLVERLYWRDQARVAGTARVNLAVRSRAEALLLEQVPRLGLGSRISLARLATPGVLAVLLGDEDARVIRAALQCPRLTEKELLRALRSEPIVPSLAEEVLRADRWSRCYTARLEIVLHPQAPLALALGQLTSLRPRDLHRVAETPKLRPLLGRAALRVLAQRP